MVRGALIVVVACLCAALASCRPIDNGTKPAAAKLPPLGTRPAPSSGAVCATDPSALGCIATQTSPVAAAAGPGKPPYPAGAADVHVVSVYQGALAGDAQRGFREHPEGVVEVVVRNTGKPVMLFLASHEPVEWRVKVEGEVLQRVLAVAGRHDPRVTIEGASGVEVATRKSGLFASLGGDLSGGLPRAAKGNGARQIAEIVNALTGKVPTTFEGAYEPKQHPFVVASTTPAFALPETKSAAAQAAGKVLLTGSRRTAADDLSVRYDGVGGMTVAWASRAYDAGKVYFEGVMTVEGGLPARPHANIGITQNDADGEMNRSLGGKTAAISHGKQPLYKTGDVFGLAADLDAGILYVRVNGQWITGEPGSGSGHHFQKGREYTAHFQATGGDGAGDKAPGMVWWQANFGASTFAHPRPAGFVSYDGSQR